MTQLRLHPLNSGFTWVDRAVEPRRLTVDQVAGFDRDGYVLLQGAFATDAIEQLTAAIDVWEAAGRGVPTAPARRHDVHRHRRRDHLHGASGRALP